MARQPTHCFRIGIQHRPAIALIDAAEFERQNCAMGRWLAGFTAYAH